MKSLFEMGFRNGFNRPMLGQLEALATIASGLFQAGAAAYGAHMQQSIAKMQQKFEKEKLAREEAAAAKQTEELKKAEQEIVQEQAKAAVTSPKILGVDRDVVVIGGVGLALLVGIIAIVASTSGKAAGTAVTQ